MALSGQRLDCELDKSQKTRGYALEFFFNQIAAHRLKETEQVICPVTDYRQKKKKNAGDFLVVYRQSWGYIWGRIKV